MHLCGEDILKIDDILATDGLLPLRIFLIFLVGYAYLFGDDPGRLGSSLHLTLSPPLQLSPLGLQPNHNSVLLIVPFLVIPRQSYFLQTSPVVFLLEMLHLL